MALMLLAACDEPRAFTLTSELVTYAEADASCELAELRGSADMQIALDMWVASPTPSDGVWVGNFIDANGTQYGYVMLRGGALVPVETTTQMRALALCVSH